MHKTISTAQLLTGLHGLLSSHPWLQQIHKEHVHAAEDYQELSCQPLGSMGQLLPIDRQP